MAGETTYANGYKNTAFKGHGGGQVCVLEATHEVTTAELQLADKIAFGKIPAGAVYLDALLACDDLDSSTGLSLELGDDDDVDGLVDGTNLGQAAGFTRGNGDYVINRKQVTAEKTIFVNVTAAATTAVAGTIRVAVYYYVP
jgi:hypothetical protein